MKLVDHCSMSSVCRIPIHVYDEFVKHDPVLTSFFSRWIHRVNFTLTGAKQSGSEKTGLCWRSYREKKFAGMCITYACCEGILHRLYVLTRSIAYAVISFQFGGC
jgi:hypothetical protein